MRKGLLHEICSVFEDAGFNLVKKTPIEKYNARVSVERRIRNTRNMRKGARSAIVAGFGGREFWEILRRRDAGAPLTGLSDEDTIDDYTRLVFDRASELLRREGINHRVAFPFGADYFAVDFLTLGEVAGFGTMSLMGILINPEYGLWMSLRGAILLEEELEEYDPPLEGFNPCPECAKPCIAPCPAAAVSVDGWDWRGCMDWRIENSSCGGGCDSRAACPWGSEHKYSKEQQTYHQSWALRWARLSKRAQDK